MSFSVTSEAPLGATRIIAVQGQLVVTNRDAFKAAVQRALSDGAARIIVDCAAATFIDSSGLGALVSLSRAAAEQGASLHLAALSPELLSLLEMTRLDTLLSICPSVDAARVA